MNETIDIHQQTRDDRPLAAIIGKFRVTAPEWVKVSQPEITFEDMLMWTRERGWNIDIYSNCGRPTFPHDPCGPPVWAHVFRQVYDPNAEGRKWVPVDEAYVEGFYVTDMLEMIVRWIATQTPHEGYEDRPAELTR